MQEADSNPEKETAWDAGLQPRLLALRFHWNCQTATSKIATATLSLAKAVSGDRQRQWLVYRVREGAAGHQTQGSYHPRSRVVKVASGQVTATISPGGTLTACQQDEDVKKAACRMCNASLNGRRTKVSERAPQLGGEAGPGGPASDAPGLLPVLVTAPGAEVSPPPPAMQAPLHTDGSHENTYTASGKAREQYARTRPPAPRAVTRGAMVGVTSSHEPGAAKAQGPSGAGAVRRRRSKSAAQGAADASHRAVSPHPRRAPPPLERGTPRAWHPRIPGGGGGRAGAVISALLSAREGLESM
ncbi:hypothetical protein R6Z07_017359 [Ovis aries]